AVQALADGTPALGIVAAVLGVIKTMGSIDSPPEVLGHMIGGALVGTFLGVFVAYGFFGPMAQALRNIYEAEAKYFLSMKTGLLAHIAGYSPVMAIEFARKMLMSEDRPSFVEIDEATSDLKLAACGRSSATWPPPPSPSSSRRSARRSPPNIAAPG